MPRYACTDLCVAHTRVHGHYHTRTQLTYNIYVVGRITVGNNSSQQPAAATTTTATTEQPNNRYTRLIRFTQWRSVSSKKSRSRSNGNRHRPYVLCVPSMWCTGPLCRGTFWPEKLTQREERWAGFKGCSFAFWHHRRIQLTDYHGMRASMSVVRVCMWTGSCTNVCARMCRMVFWLAMYLYCSNRK